MKKVLSVIFMFAVSGVCAFVSDKVTGGNFRAFMTCMSALMILSGLIYLAEINLYK